MEEEEGDECFESGSDVSSAEFVEEEGDAPHDNDEPSPPNEASGAAFSLDAGRNQALRDSDAVIEALDTAESHDGVPIPPQQHRHAPPPLFDATSWEDHLYLLVIFLIAYGGILDRLATLIILIASAVLAPLLRGSDQQLQNLPAEHKTILTTSSRISITRASIRRQLGIQDDYDRYIVCPACAHLHLWNGVAGSVAAACLQCGSNLYGGRRPALTYSHRSIASILTAVLSDRRNEDAIDGWRDFVQRAEQASSKTLDTLWSGRLWQADCSNVGCSTTCNSRHMSYVTFGGNLKITLSIDWFSPFKGRYLGHHSSGAILLRIDNIPDSVVTVDCRCASIHLIGILPGPKEQTLALLTPYLKLLTDELKTLYRDEIRLKTARHPEGEYFELQICSVNAARRTDEELTCPARSKIGGVAMQRTKRKGCLYCYFDLDNLGRSHASTSRKRSSTHRQHSLACSTVDGAQQYKEDGVRYSVLHKLPYFSTPTMCPPDYMHAVHLGLCKRFFHKFLIDGCRRIGGKLPALLKVVNDTFLPSTAKRPDHRISEPSGGNPNAEQWLTFFRHQLVFHLLKIWSQSLGGAAWLQLQFEPEVVSQWCEVLTGNKLVEDVFESALLLCAIVNYMERKLIESEVKPLDKLIVRYNDQQANLLGPGWLTYNSHIAKHIPKFILQYGSSKNFSCYAFESYNGVLGNMRKATQKGGAAEDSMMRITTQWTEVERLLAECPSEIMKKELAKYIHGTHVDLGQFSEMKMAMHRMESSTQRLLIEFLNRPHKSIRGMYKASMDSTLGSDDVGITPTAQHFHSLVKESFPHPIRYSSASQGSSVNVGNTFVLVLLTLHCSLMAQILWIFKKSI
ncbi:conserved hypothetical Ustilaginaceae-specific protein [Sporisorium reilianum SRZ2]|uniref:Conserved hypothetical Ustilaginaceae-specific protein n=1 Tax=Sporisorium reilianum (strain SRZ2) TaxID=999809 RepID=E6ZQ24_SPORE|nr:conserved hypothetical Ustilaginaceae-specific protein [Sporisorium reilianum SRZ2]